MKIPILKKKAEKNEKVIVNNSITVKYMGGSNENNKRLTDVVNGQRQNNVIMVSFEE